MFSNRSFKTLISTSNLINISTSMTMLGKLDTFNDGFKTLLDTEYFENIATRLDDKSDSKFSNSRLVYSMNGNILQYDNTDLIINLLLQIRAIQNGQNSFVKSVSTVKDQVIDQLQRELLFAKSYLNDSQINQIKVIIGNNASNEDDFNRLLSSLYKNLKKKIVETDENKKLNNISYNSIEDNYDPLTKKVLKNTENAERLSTRVNLINIETNKEQVEELKVKLSEKLNRVYEKNIEEFVKDSYEVLSKKEIDEKVLDRLIENIKIEEKETLKTLKKEEKQKEVQRILKKELKQIYETNVEQSLKDTKEVLTKNEVNTEVIERLLSTTNTILDVKEKLSKQKNLILDVKGKYDPLTEKVLKKTEKTERLSTRVNLVNIETNKEQVEELKIKLSEKLNKVYEKNVEESIKDSYEVLSKKEIDEKILDRVIENIKIEEKETLKTLKKEEKQKEIQKILKKELEQIYETNIEESLKDTKEILTKSEINNEIIERLLKTTNIVLRPKKEIISEKVIEKNYDPITEKVLKNTEKTEKLSTRVNLINIETNKEQIEELKTKLSKRLERIYEKNIEESVRDSYEVLSKKEVDEKVLDRLIESIKIKERETLKTLQKEEKRKEIQRVLKKELKKIYEINVEESLKDTREILTKNQISKELIERLCETTNTILNTRNEIKNDYNPLIKKILNKTENAEVLNKKVNLINIETNNENVSFLKNIKNVLETNTKKNTYRIINKGINILNDEYISNFAYNKNSNNETIEKIENEYLDKIIKKYKINTVFKGTNTKSMRREINSKRLNYLKSESSKLEDTLGIVGSKLSNMVPKNKKMSILDTNKIIGKKLSPEDNTYVDTPSFSKVYYNDAVEHIGKSFLTSVSGSLGNDLSQPGKLVHKAPIKLPEPKEDDKDMYEGQSVLESQLLGKSYPNVPEKSNYNQLNSNRNVMNEEKTKRLIRDYVSDLDLNIDSISRKVMNRIEKMMQTDRRRFGMFR